MPDLVRKLNADGILRLKEYVVSRKAGVDAFDTRSLLNDPSTSVPLDIAIKVERRTFANRYEFGEYLVGLLAPIDRRRLVRDHALWNWLAAYFIEEMLPKNHPPEKVLSMEAYVLPERYNFRDYYRHLVRTPWLAVSEHGEFAKILLIPRVVPTGPVLAHRGELQEQLASRQTVFRNRRVMEAIYTLYWDHEEGKPRPGVAGKRDVNGPPRRLATVLLQLERTFDLYSITVPDLVALLPKEFNKWK